MRFTEAQLSRMHDLDNLRLEAAWRELLAEFENDPEAFADNKKDGPIIQEFDGGRMLALDRAIKQVKKAPKPREWRPRPVVVETPKEKLQRWFKDRGDGPIPRPLEPPPSPPPPRARMSENALKGDRERPSRAPEVRRLELERRKQDWLKRFPLYDISC